jgi:hypothetical protein
MKNEHKALANYSLIGNSAGVDTWINDSLKHRNEKNDEHWVQRLHLVWLDATKLTLHGIRNFHFKKERKALCSFHLFMFTTDISA